MVPMALKNSVGNRASKVNKPLIDYFYFICNTNVKDDKELDSWLKKNM